MMKIDNIECYLIVNNDNIRESAQFLLLSKIILKRYWLKIAVCRAVPSNVNIVHAKPI